MCARSASDLRQQFGFLLLELVFGQDAVLPQAVELGDHAHHVAIAASGRAGCALLQLLLGIQHGGLEADGLPDLPEVVYPQLAGSEDLDIAVVQESPKKGLLELDVV